MVLEDAKSSWDPLEAGLQVPTTVREGSGALPNPSVPWLAAQGVRGFRGLGLPIVFVVWGSFSSFCSWWFWQTSLTTQTPLKEAEQ